MIRFNNILIFALFFTVSYNISFAEEVNNNTMSIVDIINADPSASIKIIQSENINNRILDITNEDNTSKKKTQITAGKQISYRILAFNKANQRENALNLAQQINKLFPLYGAKVTSNLPYWQVWVGTFFNEEDAQKAVKELKRAFPKENFSIRKKNIIVTQ